ncbi:hypothetical protein N0A02_32005 [Paraburkholderia acidicola]|uniref:Uncharacterized protein n=1 Tax=Paraburkholderia acidicola TaxID=1912599 RepID=A0ABV1LXR9_9BURK
MKWFAILSDEQYATNQIALIFISFEACDSMAHWAANPSSQATDKRCLYGEFLTFWLPRTRRDFHGFSAVANTK